MINNSVDRNGTKITGKSTGTGLDITEKLCFIMFECCWLVVCRPEYFSNTSFPFFSPRCLPLISTLTFCYSALTL